MKKFLLVLVVLMACIGARAQGVLELKVLPVCWQYSSAVDSTIYAYWLMSSELPQPRLISYLNLTGTEVIGVDDTALSTGQCCCESTGSSGPAADSIAIIEGNIIVLYDGNVELARDTLDIQVQATGIAQTCSDTVTISGFTPQLFMPLHRDGTTLSPADTTQLASFVIVDVVSSTEVVICHEGFYPTTQDQGLYYTSAVAGVADTFVYDQNRQYLYEVYNGFAYVDVGDIVLDSGTGGSVSIEGKYTIAVLQDSIVTLLLDGIEVSRDTISIQGTGPVTFPTYTVEVVQDSIITLLRDGVEVSRDTVSIGPVSSQVDIVASNGLNDFDTSANVDVELGGALERNTEVSGLWDHWMIWDSLTFSRIRSGTPDETIDQQVGNLGGPNSFYIVRRTNDSITQVIDLTRTSGKDLARILTQNSNTSSLANLILDATGEAKLTANSERTRLPIGFNARADLSTPELRVVTPGIVNSTLLNGSVLTLIDSVSGSAEFARFDSLLSVYDIRLATDDQILTDDRLTDFGSNSYTWDLRDVRADEMAHSVLTPDGRTYGWYAADGARDLAWRTDRISSSNAGSMLSYSTDEVRLGNNGDDSYILGDHLFLEHRNIQTDNSNAKVLAVDPVTNELEQVDFSVAASSAIVDTVTISGFTPQLLMPIHRDGTTLSQADTANLASFVIVNVVSSTEVVISHSGVYATALPDGLYYTPSTPGAATTTAFSDNRQFLFEVFDGFAYVDVADVVIGGAGGSQSVASNVSILSANQTDLPAGDYVLDASTGSFTIALANTPGTWRISDPNQTLVTNQVTLLHEGTRTFTSGSGAQVSQDLVLDAALANISVYSEDGANYRIPYPLSPASSSNAAAVLNFSGAAQSFTTAANRLYRKTSNGDVTWTLTDGLAQGESFMVNCRQNQTGTLTLNYSGGFQNGLSSPNSIVLDQGDVASFIKVGSSTYLVTSIYPAN